MENPHSDQAQVYRYKQSKEFWEVFLNHYEQMKAKLYSADIAIEGQLISTKDIKKYVTQQTRKSLFEIIQEISYLLSKRVSEHRREAFLKEIMKQFKKRINAIGSLSDYYRL